MRNGLIGFFAIIILILSGVAISTAEGRSMHKNELDASFGKAMEQTLSVLKAEEVYAIDTELQMAADFLENTLIQMNPHSKSSLGYEVTIYSLDLEKGLIDAGVKQSFQQVFGIGTVSVRKTALLEEYVNDDNTYYLVTFTDKEQQIKQISVHAGDRLTAASLPKTDEDTQWVCNGNTYTAATINSVIVTDYMEFTRVR